MLFKRSEGVCVPAAGKIPIISETPSKWVTCCNLPVISFLIQCLLLLLLACPSLFYSIQFCLCWHCEFYRKLSNLSQVLRAGLPSTTSHLKPSPSGGLFSAVFPLDYFPWPIPKPRLTLHLHCPSHFSCQLPSELYIFSHLFSHLVDMYWVPTVHQARPGIRRWADQVPVLSLAFSCLVPSGKLLSYEQQKLVGGCT